MAEQTAEVSRRIKIVEVLQRHGALGMEISELRKTLGVGKGHAFASAIQELERAGAVERCSNTRWRVVTRIE